MPLRRACLALLLCASALPAADVNTLKLGLVTGEIVSISDKEVVLNKNGQKLTIPLDEVLQIDYGTAGRPKAEDKYSDVELTDGTVLHCGSFLVKKDKAVFTLLATGQEVTAPLSTVANVLLEANVVKNRKDWDERIGNKRTNDALVLAKGEKVASLEGTFTEGDETGAIIKFTTKPGLVREIKIADSYGLIFARGVNAAARPVVCRLTDAQGNLVYVSAVTATEAGVAVETSCGVKIAYTPKSVARLDYTSGKIAYLADLKPSNLVETSPFDTAEHYQVNRNLDGGPLKLEGKVYTSGLAVHAYTELEYDIKGEYREFKAFVGVDDTVGGHDGPTTVQVFGSSDRGANGEFKELAKLVVERKDRGKAPKPLAINVKDVQKLRIIVGNGDLQDIGKHVDLADAKVTK